MPITVSNAACPLKRLIGILCMLLFLETGIASEAPVDFEGAWLQVQQINIRIELLSLLCSARPE